jgi:hypothetical protein
VDPITILLIGTGGAAVAGIAAVAGPLVRHLRLRRARELITRPVVGATGGGDAPRSVYDVFRDLGSSEYAIEVMRHMDLIPETEEDLEVVASSLTDAVSSFGGYALLVASLRETIQELSSESDDGHAEILERRLTLTAPRVTDALLPAVGRPSGGAALTEGAEVKRLPADAGPSSTGGSSVPSRSSRPPDEPRLHATVDEALAELFGDGRSPHAGTLEDGAGGIAAVVVGGVLGSLTQGGGFWEGVSRYVHKRRVKQMRGRLAAELTGLSLDLFHAPAEIGMRVDHNLQAFVQQQRWTVERRRRDTARHRKLPRQQRSTSQMALKLLAAQRARQGLAEAERDVKRLAAQITRHRRAGRHDLAGFLIYVNRADMLRGIDTFGPRVRAIEEAAEQLRRALLAEVPVPGSPTADDGSGASTSTPGQPAAAPWGGPDGDLGE